MQSNNIITFLFALLIVATLVFVIHRLNESSIEFNSTLNTINSKIDKIISDDKNSQKGSQRGQVEYENTYKDLINLIARERENYFENLTIFFTGFSVVFALIAIGIPILINLTSSQEIKEIKSEIKIINAGISKSSKQFQDIEQRFEPLNLENIMIKMVNFSILLSIDGDYTWSSSIYRKKIIQYINEIEKCAKKEMEIDFEEIKVIFTHLSKSIQKITMITADRPFFTKQDELKTLIEEKILSDELDVKKLESIIPNIRSKVDEFFDEYENQIKQLKQNAA